MLHEIPHWEITLDWGKVPGKYIRMSALLKKKNLLNLLLLRHAQIKQFSEGQARSNDSRFQMKTSADKRKSIIMISI